MKRFIFQEVEFVSSFNLNVLTIFKLISSGVSEHFRIYLVPLLDQK